MKTNTTESCSILFCRRRASVEATNMAYPPFRPPQPSCTIRRNRYSRRVCTDHSRSTKLECWVVKDDPNIPSIPIITVWVRRPLVLIPRNRFICRPNPTPLPRLKHRQIFTKISVITDCLRPDLSDKINS
jgi:hypothetical protein